MKNQKSLETKIDNIEKILTEHSKQPMSFKEACKYLNISESQLYKFTHKNKLSYYKPGGKMIYFSKQDLDNWIFKHRIKSDEEANEFINTYLKKNNIKLD